MSEFMEWFKELVEQGENRNWPINTEDPEAYRDYFDNGYDVDDAITEDMQCCD